MVQPCLEFLKIESRHVGSAGNDLSRLGCSFLVLVGVFHITHHWEGSRSKHEHLEQFPGMSLCRLLGDRFGFGWKELEPQPVADGKQAGSNKLVGIHISNEVKDQGKIGDKRTQEAHGKNHHMGQKEECCRIEL